MTDPAFNRRINFLYLYCALLTIACVYLFHANSRHTVLKSLTIVDSTGHRMLVASRTLPSPVIDGKEHKREINLGGITLYDTHGNEAGGIGMLDNNSLRETMLSFDYKLNDAIGIYTLDQGKTFESGITVQDKDLRATDPQKARPVQRISISDENKNASIILRDSKGRDRIVLSVDSNDVAKIVLKDTLGNIAR